jgi:hypothetical protein
MDGIPRATRSLARLRIAAVLAVLLACLATAVAAADDTTPPDQRWPEGGAAITTASEIAEARWADSHVCNGDLTIYWGRLNPQYNATSSWSNPVDDYAAPDRNESCEIELNVRADWDWPKLCTVLVHEFGHLTGHRHADDPDDVMYYAYVQPIPECAQTPEPVQPAPVATPATAAPALAPTATAPAAAQQPAARHRAAKAPKRAKKQRRAKRRR